MAAPPLGRRARERVKPGDRGSGRPFPPCSFHLLMGLPGRAPSPVPGHDLPHQGIRVFPGMPAQGALLAHLSQKPDQPMYNHSLAVKFLNRMTLLLPRAEGKPPDTLRRNKPGILPRLAAPPSEDSLAPDGIHRVRQPDLGEIAVGGGPRPAPAGTGLQVDEFP